MKRSFILSLVMLINLIAFAQAPQKMSYQAVIRNNSDQLVTNQAIGIRISILQGSPTGTDIYVETQRPTTNANGLATFEIGGGNVVRGTFAGINWTSGVYFIKTEIDPSGGRSYTITGTSQILSVPYALYAKISETSANAVTITGDNIIAGTKTFTGTVTVPTPVNATDATTKAYVDNALKELGLIPNNYSGLVSDIEGNNYKTVTIGTQTWMAENLRVARYKDGTAIPLVSGNAAWSSLTTPGYCWYNNDEATNKATYGALYNWHTVNTGNLCPAGWHVPTDAEWTTLTSYLGGESDSGAKLKETGTAHWASPNTSATNETGFTALPGGYRDFSGPCLLIGGIGQWWSSSPYSAINVWDRVMSYYSGDVVRDNSKKQNGFSVRCLRDF
jgi:uncharacterized protein (TIGR02145 family)